MNFRWYHAVGLAIIFIAFGGCKNQTSIPVIPKEARIIQPVYSHLFTLGFGSSDTFLILHHPEDSCQTIGAFVWGSERNYPGFVPLKHRQRIAAMSTVFIGMIEALHGENAIVGVDNVSFISSPRTVQRIQSKQIISLNPNGNILKEKVIALKPDLILGYFIDKKGKSELEEFSKQGIPVLFLQNYLENHPLGRAEWILVFGALMGKSAEAAALFQEIEEHYASTKERSKELKYRPTVIMNAPFSGTWDVPSGESYMANLVQDAGADYVFREHKGAGRIPLGIEDVYAKGGKADFWLNPGACRTKNCLRQMDKRLANFASFQNNQIYNCTHLLKENGANPWWEYGVLRPDLALLDLLSIFHPEAEWEHVPVFFEAIDK